MSEQADKGRRRLAYQVNWIANIIRRWRRSGEPRLSGGIHWNQKAPVEAAAVRLSRVSAAKVNCCSVSKTRPRPRGDCCCCLERDRDCETVQVTNHFEVLAAVKNAYQVSDSQHQVKKNLLMFISSRARLSSGGDAGKSFTRICPSNFFNINM